MDIAKKYQVKASDMSE
jgi:dynein light chain LC8-type